MKIAVDQIEGLAELIASQGGGGGGVGLPGSKLSYDPSNPTTVVVAAGKQQDSTGAITITLPLSVRKSVTGLWIPGDNQSGRDGGALTNSVGYHVYAIYNATTKATDVLLSQSATFPVLPTGWTHFRRLGAVMVDTAGQVRRFKQFGRKFDLLTPVNDYQSVINAGMNLRKISVPQGRKVTARIYFQTRGNFDAPYHSGMYDPDLGTPPAFGTTSQYAQVRRFGAMDVNMIPTSYVAGIYDVMTNANAQIYTGSNDAQDYIVVRLLGWEDNIDDLL